MALVRARACARRVRIGVKPAKNSGRWVRASSVLRRADGGLRGVGAALERLEADHLRRSRGGWRVERVRHVILLPWVKGAAPRVPRSRLVQYFHLVVIS